MPVQCHAFHKRTLGVNTTLVAYPKHHADISRFRNGEIHAASMLAAYSKATSGSSKRNPRKTSHKHPFHIDTIRCVLKATEQDEYAILTLFGRYEPIASIPQTSAVDPSARAGYSPQVPPSRHLLPAFPFVELVIPPVFTHSKCPMSLSSELCSHDDGCVIMNADAGRAYNFRDCSSDYVDTKRGCILPRTTAVWPRFILGYVGSVVRCAY